MVSLHEEIFTKALESYSEYCKQPSGYRYKEGPPLFLSINYDTLHVSGSHSGMVDTQLLLDQEAI